MALPGASGARFSNQPALPMSGRPPPLAPLPRPGLVLPRSEFTSWPGLLYFCPGVAYLWARRTARRGRLARRTASTRGSTSQPLAGIYATVASGTTTSFVEQLASTRRGVVLGAVPLQHYMKELLQELSGTCRKILHGHTSDVLQQLQPRRELADLRPSDGRAGARRDPALGGERPPELSDVVHAVPQLRARQSLPDGGLTPTAATPRYAPTRGHRREALVAPRAGSDRVEDRDRGGPRTRQDYDFTVRRVLLAYAQRRGLQNE